MSTRASNKVTYLLATKKIDFSADVFKIILMASGFVFNTDTHEAYADVSASELPTAYGYTVGGATLAGVAVTEDDANDRTAVTWTPNPSWTASGGTLTASGAIIYDDTTTTPADAIMGYIDFGGDLSAASGSPFVVANPAIYIRNPA